jgi:hypothetical protein
MKQPSNIPRKGTKSSQAGTARGRPRSVLFASFRILGASFLVLGILTIALCSATTNGGEFMRTFLVFLFTGENAVQFFAHLSGMFTTIALIGLFALFATFLHLLMKGTSRYDKVLAALRFTLKHDPNNRVRAEAAKGLAKLDVEESTRHQEHEELDDVLVSTLRGGQKDVSPGVRTTVAEGLSELELEQHSYEHEHNQLDDRLFRHNP